MQQHQQQVNQEEFSGEEQDHLDDVVSEAGIAIIDTTEDALRE